MIYLYPTMIPSDTFKTIHLPATGIYKEKGSSFISYIYPLLDESKTKPILAELKKEHAKARHICYAYQWGPDPDYTRHQDDGEPSGTAGKPILGQIRSHQLENVLLAVVRYLAVRCWVLQDWARLTNQLHWMPFNMVKSSPYPAMSILN